MGHEVHISLVKDNTQLMKDLFFTINEHFPCHFFFFNSKNQHLKPLEKKKGDKALTSSTNQHSKEATNDLLHIKTEILYGVPSNC